jgi:hypothetical protein
MVHFLSGANIVGLKSEIYFALGIADLAYAAEGLECVITSAADGAHLPNSKHYKGEAVDLRNVNCSAEQKANIKARLSRLERYGFDVIDELPKASANTTGAHFHIEFDPKAGEKLFREM